MERASPWIDSGRASRPPERGAHSELGGESPCGVAIWGTVAPERHAGIRRSESAGVGGVGGEQIAAKRFWLTEVGKSIGSRQRSCLAPFSFKSRTLQWFPIPLRKNFVGKIKAFPSYRCWVRFAGHLGSCCPLRRFRKAFIAEKTLIARRNRLRRTAWRSFDRINGGCSWEGVCSS